MAACHSESARPVCRIGVPTGSADAYTSAIPAHGAPERGFTMTEPAGGAPTPPTPPEPAAPPPAAAPAAPPPVAAAPPPQGGGNWGAPPAAGQPTQPAFQAPAQFQPVAAELGPAPGILYADLTTRIIAFIIDAILLGILSFVVNILLGSLFLGSLFGGGVFLALIFAVLLAIAGLAISAAYFIWGWTNPTMRASLGQKVMSLQTVSAADGSTLTRPVAIRRWAFLYGFVAVASALQLGLSATSLSALSPLISLLTLGYVIYLLWTTSQSPKRQGFHDVQAGTVVIKAAK